MTHGAWLRYGTPLDDRQINFAIDHYRVVVLQPWETVAADRLKSARPDMIVLCYKCLSSTRSYEPGPIFSSGVDYLEAEEAGEDWFAHRADGTTRVEWANYPGHVQMATWNPEYRERWCDNVVDDLEDSPWDGVMADNDVFDDYYGLRPPLEGGRMMADLRRALDEFVPQAGARLNAIDKLLVPNIAEARREPGRWARHAAFGGGFEEVFLAWQPDEYLDPPSALQQCGQAAGPGVTILRTATDGTDEHPNFLYGLAAFWVFGGGGGTGFTATAHDGYDDTPYIPQLEWELGTPLETPQARGNAYSRRFTRGWAAVNLNNRRRREVSFQVPGELIGVDGHPAPERVTLQPHHGVLYLAKASA